MQAAIAPQPDHISDAELARRIAARPCAAAFSAPAACCAALARDADFAFEQAFSFDGARCDRIVAGVLERLTPRFSIHHSTNRWRTPCPF